MSRWYWGPFFRALAYTVASVAMYLIPYGLPIAAFAGAITCLIGLMQCVRSLIDIASGDYIARKWLAVGITTAFPPLIALVWTSLDTTLYRFIVALLFIILQAFALLFIVWPDRQR